MNYPFLVDLISSVECQIEHWRSGHRYECVETETETAKTVKKSKKVKVNTCHSWTMSLFFLFVFSVSVILSPVLPVHFVICNCKLGLK